MLSKSQLNNLSTVVKSEIPKFSLDGRIIPAKVTSVYDADTCSVVFYLEGKLVQFSIRLLGIDTPEMRPSMKKPNRDLEKKAAKRSRNRLIQLVTNVDMDVDSQYGKKKCQTLIDKNTKIILLHCGPFDKYGRLLGTLYEFDNSKNIEKTKTGGGTSFNKQLIQEGYAREYHGGTKQPWDFSK